jgi:hypothetical protein
MLFPIINFLFGRRAPPRAGRPPRKGAPAPRRRRAAAPQNTAHLHSEALCIELVEWLFTLRHEATTLHKTSINFQQRVSE